MFQCQNCLATTRPGVEAVRVVVKKRRTTYPVRPQVHVVIEPEKKQKKRNRKKSDDPGGVGWSIETELAVCPAYAAALSSDTA